MIFSSSSIQDHDDSPAATAGPDPRRPGSTVTYEREDRSNVPLSETQRTKIAGGEDTTHISFYCKWSRTSPTLRMLQHAKLQAQLPRPKDADEDALPATEVTFGEHTYQVSPEGFSADKSGAKFSYYPYRMRDGGITIGVAARDCDPDSTTPNIRVEIGSLPLILAGGLPQIWPEIQKRLQALGVHVLKNRIGRVDPCVDLVGCSVSELQSALRERRYVSRAKRSRVYTRLEVNDSQEVIASEFDDPLEISEHADGWKDTGFTIGRSRILCRGYNKLAEMAHNEEKQQAMITCRYGEVPATAVRVEFQLTREALRGFTIVGKKNGIETVEDWIEHRGAICTYLCTQWLKFVNETFDARHTERITAEHLHPIWKRVIAAFHEWTSAAAAKVERVAKSIKLQSEPLINQAVGCFTTSVLRAGYDINPDEPQWEDKFLDHVMRAFKQSLTRKDFFRKVRAKEDRIEISIPRSAIHPFKRVENCVVGVTHSQPRAVSWPSDRPSASGPA